MQKLQDLFYTYQRFQIFLRRYPLADAVIIYQLVGFGGLSIWCPTAVTQHSHFHHLEPVIGVIGLLCLLVGLFHFGATFLAKSPLYRQIAASASLVMLLGLTYSVDSVTGRLAWSGHTTTDFLIVLAVVK